MQATPTLNSPAKDLPLQEWLHSHMYSGFSKFELPIKNHKGHISLCGSCCGAVAVDADGLIHSLAMSTRNYSVSICDLPLKEYDEKVRKEIPEGSKQFEIENGQQICFGLGCSADKLKEYTGYPADSPSYELRDGDNILSFVWKDD